MFTYPISYAVIGDVYMKLLWRFSLFALFLLVLFFGKETFQGAYDALLIWFEKLVPSMFVTMVLIRFMYRQQVFDSFRLPFVQRLFHMDNKSFSLVLCTIFLGFPSGAMFVDEAYAQGNIEERSAKRLLYTCSFPTPGFVIMSCGVVIFRSATIGFLLFFVQITSGLCLLWLTRKTPIVFHERVETHYNHKMNDLSTSLWESGKALFFIGGYLMLFMSCTSILFSILPDSYAFPLQILSEFSSGTIILNTLPLNNTTALVLSSMLLSFGGFCVHMQVCSMIEHCPFSYLKFLGFRLMQSLLSALILYAFLL